MKPWPQVDFGQLIDEVKQPRHGPGDLTILGGECAEIDLLDFLQQWSDSVEIPYRVWEMTSETVFEENTLAQNTALLERARLFGSGGDLMLRREGTSFAWRFIGPPGVQRNNGANDYWRSHPDATFCRCEETVLLWGEQKDNCWVDDRVGAARLNYPAQGRRLQLHFYAFSFGGQVEFVWYTGLSEWEGADIND